jgi:hypothetical protein
MGDLNVFVLPDPYEGKAADELRADCRRLSRGIGKLQRIIMEMISTLEEDGVAALPPLSRDYANKLIEAYKD